LFGAPEAFPFLTVALPASCPPTPERKWYTQQDTGASVSRKFVIFHRYGRGQDTQKRDRPGERHEHAPHSCNRLAPKPLGRCEGGKHEQ
jgi:hypothetical protein